MPRIAVAFAVIATLACCIGFNISRYPAVWEMAASSRHISQPDASVQSSVAFRSSPREEVEARIGPEAPPEPDPNAQWTTSVGSTPVEPITAYPSETGEGGSPGWTEGVPIAAAAVSGRPDEVESFDDAKTPDYTDRAKYTESPGAAAAEPQIIIEEPEPSDSLAVTEQQPEDPVGQPPAGPIEVLPSMKYGSSAVGLPAEDPPQVSGSEAVHSERPLVAVRLPQRPDKSPASPASPDIQVSENPPGVADRFSAKAMVERLPPVDEVWNDPEQDREPLLPESPIPIYPTTGIE